jgi:hypothetical protein
VNLVVTSDRSNGKNAGQFWFMVMAIAAAVSAIGVLTLPVGPVAKNCFGRGQPALTKERMLFSEGAGSDTHLRFRPERPVVLKRD